MLNKEESKQVQQSLDNFILASQAETSTPLSELKLISQRESRGKIFLGQLFRPLKITGVEEYFLTDGLFEIMLKIEQAVCILYKKGKRPKFFTLEYENTYTWSNCRDEYVYSVNFFE